jgi:hypothetical protein
MMSLTVIIAIVAILATLSAALLQPIISHWLTPKQKLRLDVTGSQYVTPPAILREMSKYYIQLRVHNAKLQPEFGDFLRDAERYHSFFDVTVTNTGKTISRNVFLACSAYSKYVIIQTRNKSEYHSDEPEYLLGDLQPSEKIRCHIWSTSSFPAYDFAAKEMFSVRDDHDSPKQIVLRRFYDKTSHYLLDRSVVENLASAFKWIVLPPLLIWLIIYLGIWAFHALWPAVG